MKPFVCWSLCVCLFSSGCGFVLEWLHQKYWSQQLGSQLAEDWKSSEEEEDEEAYAKRQEEILVNRQREIEGHSEY